MAGSSVTTFIYFKVLIILSQKQIKAIQLCKLYGCRYVVINYAETLSLQVLRYNLIFNQNFWGRKFQLNIETYYYLVVGKLYYEYIVLNSKYDFLSLTFYRISIIFLFSS